MKLKVFRPVSLLLILFVIFYYFTIDTIMKKSLIKTSEIIFGAKASVNKFVFKLNNLNTNLYEYKVADVDNPMKNLFEIGQINFSLSLLPLLEKKFIVKTLAIENIDFNTDRSTSGKLERIKLAKKKKVKKEIKRIKDIGLMRISDNINFDKMIDHESLESYKEAKELKMFSKSKTIEWNAKFKNIDYKNDKDNIEHTISKIKGTKTIPEISTALIELKTQKEDLDKKIKEYGVIKNNFIKDKNSFRENVKNITEGVVREKDYNILLEKLDFKQINTKNISNIILGPTIMSHIDNILSFRLKIRSYIPKNIRVKKDKVHKTKKVKILGRTILFPKETGYPTFLIKKLLLSGKSKINNQSYDINGIITSLTSNQDISKNPTTAKIQFHGVDNPNYSIIAEFDYRFNQDLEKFDIFASNIDFSNLNLGESLPNFKKGVGEVKLNLEFLDNKYKIVFDLTIKNAKFDIQNMKPKNEFERILKQVYSNVSDLKIQGTIENDGKKSTFNFTSNLDKYFNKTLKGIMDKKITLIKKELRKKLNAELIKISETLDMDIKKWKNIENITELKERGLFEVQNKINEVIKENEKKIEREKEKVNLEMDLKKKELEDKINEGKEEIGNKIKGLFK